ncbi:olfactory receptor 5V1-like [Gastrophryne carolinensis]
MQNDSTVSEFILLGFSSFFSNQIALFCSFLTFYIFTLLGNVIVIVVSTLRPELHTPMYFFLSTLAFLEIFYTSVTIPKMLLNFLKQTNSISYAACVAQTYFFIALGSIECTLLAVMAYDRYVAICNPLHYVIIMDTCTCVELIFSSWISGFVNSMIHTTCIFHLKYCSSNRINQFFCDIPPLLKVACGSTLFAEIVLFVVGGAYGCCSFLLTLISYIYIISAILKIQSKKGQQRAFSTCASHLIVVTLFFGSSFSAYLKPTSKNATEIEKLVPVLYAVITPTLNPIIYTLRNKEFKCAVWKLMDTVTLKWAHKLQSLF